MITPRFLVAKYIPDLFRLEPRNFGIIAWGDGGNVASRFLGVNADGTVEVPPLIERRSHHAYREWLDFWRYQLAKDSIANKSGEKISRDSTNYLDALMQTSKEQFRLVDGGYMTQRIKVGELESFAEELFSQLVEKEPVSKARAEAMELNEAYKHILETTGINKRSDFHTNLPLPRRVYGKLRYFTADSALGATGNPSAIIHRVLLTRDQNIDSSTLMFGAVVNDTDRPIQKENCAALVSIKGQNLSESAKNGLDVLDGVATLIDVADSYASQRILEIAARSGAEPN
jgi:hypothetical protein